MFEHVRLEGEFTLSSGRKSKYFYDFDRFAPHEHLKASHELFKLVKDVRFDYIVAPALGGIIPAFIVAGAHGAPLLIIDHEGNIRGNCREGAFKYLMVDDVVTSMETAHRVYGALNGASDERKCVGIASYIFRGTDKDLAIGKAHFDTVAFLERKEVEE
jgi:orotate phosphoribosyltransferase